MPARDSTIIPQCSGSWQSYWESVSSDFVKCPVCGWTTHWLNANRAHAVDAYLQERRFQIRTDPYLFVGGFDEDCAYL